MKVIKLITDEKEFLRCTDVIRESFLTVAKEFDLTPDNAPTNPAFMTYEKLKESAAKGMELFGLYDEGCIAIERSKEDSVFFIERLAVLPVWRHNGYGRMLMDHAFVEIINRGGMKASIGIINENIVLKKWYEDYGFKETGIRKFDHLPFTVCFMEKNVTG